jgi:hypothetical protein
MVSAAVGNGGVSQLAVVTTWSDCLGAQHRQLYSWRWTCPAPALVGWSAPHSVQHRRRPIPVLDLPNHSQSERGEQVGRWALLVSWREGRHAGSRCVTDKDRSSPGRGLGRLRLKPLACMPAPSMHACKQSTHACARMHVHACKACARMRVPHAHARMRPPHASPLTCF